MRIWKYIMKDSINSFSYMMEYVFEHLLDGENAL